MADRVDTMITLISHGQSVEYDDFLQPIPGQEIRAEVFATFVPVSRSEFYSAGEKGFRPDFIFEVNPAEYSGQADAEVYDLETGITEKCRIYRTYRSDPDTLELYMSRAAGLDETPDPEPTPDPDPEVNGDADTETSQPDTEESVISG